jgi:hypothetical protein
MQINVDCETGNKGKNFIRIQNSEFRMQIKFPFFILIAMLNVEICKIHIKFVHQIKRIHP